jgi:hypothetical protein
MARGKRPWAPPLVEMSGGMAGHLLAWEKIDGDGSWWACVSWVQESGGRHLHKVVQVRAATRARWSHPAPTSRCRGGCPAATGRSGRRADERQPALAMQPAGSALAPMSAAGTGCQDPTGVAPCTVVGGNVAPEPG